MQCSSQVISEILPEIHTVEMCDCLKPIIEVVGWCDGAGETSSAGASYNLDDSRARAYCACSRCGWGLFGHFYSHLSFLSSFSLSLGDRPI